MRSPAHPGRLIKNELDEMGLGVTAVAALLDVTPQLLDAIIAGDSPVTLQIAVDLERVIGSTAEAWLRMQVAHDLAQHGLRGAAPMKSPPHPGFGLRDDIAALGWTVTEAADALCVERGMLESVIDGKSPVTPEIAVGLERVIGGTAETWLRMQAAYDSSLEREWMDAPDVGLEKYEQALIGILDGSGSTWGVRIPDLPGCHGAGATPGDAVRDAASAAQDWIAHQTGKGLPIPLPRSADAIMADPDVEFRPDLGEIAVVVA